MDEQTGCILGGFGIIGSPFVEDQEDKVAKQAAHEDNFWDEAQEDVQWLLEVPGQKKTNIFTLQAREIT